MNKTRVDDMLIEMIRPKIEEIEKKFSSQEPLTQDDINTLLLKSQYNHINHLDDKLNETVESVKNLEHKFEKVEQRFDYLENKLTGDMKNLEDKLTGDMNNLENKLTTDMKSLEERLSNQYKNLETKLTTDMKSLEERLSNQYKNLETKLTADMKSLEERLETTIQKALNKNMMLLIVVIGFFMTLSKLIDKF